jgi:hypothetical protein
LPAASSMRGLCLLASFCLFFLPLLTGIARETNGVAALSATDSATAPALTNANATNVLSGTPPRPESSPTEIKVVIFWLGPSLLFLLLALFNLAQMFRSKSGQETLAKGLVNCLGFVLVFWLWNTLGIDHTRGLRAYLTSPAPPGASAQVWSGVASAAAMFAFLFVLEALGDLTAGKSYFQATTVFLSCVGLYLLSPLMGLLWNATHLLNSRLFHISTGMLIGGIFYVILLLFYLGKRKSKGSFPTWADSSKAR